MITNLGFMLMMVCFVFAAYYFHSLTISGAITSFIVGTAVYIGFGINGFILLGAFFATSSFWSKYKSSQKTNLEEKLEKGARRDWYQVVANGGIAAVLGITNYFYQDNLWLIAFGITLSSANSDTWASEIGSLSKNEPIDIRTFKRVEKGTSGAVSLLGTAAAVCGAILIAVIATILFKFDLIYMIFIFLFGFLGNAIDTLMGAYFQVLYRCSACRIETERKVHCGQETEKIRGLTGLDNDMVNYISCFLPVILFLLFAKVIL